MLRTPNTRPRVSSGMSSWSCVCDGIATNAYAMPASSAMKITIASRDVKSGQRHQAGGQLRPSCRNFAIGPAATIRMTKMPERDQTALDDPAPRHQVPEGVEDQDAHHDAEPERQDDDHEVLVREPQRLRRELRTEHAQDADERGGDPEVDERPADRLVGADERDALAKLREGRAHRLLGLRAADARLPRFGSDAPAARPAASSRSRPRPGSRRATTRISPGAPSSVTTSGPISAYPTAKAALSVRVNTPFAAVSCRRGTTVGIIAASAGREEDRHRRDERVEQEQHRQEVPGQEQQHEQPGPQRVRDDEDRAACPAGPRRRRRPPRTGPRAPGTSGSGGCRRCWRRRLERR